MGAAELIHEGIYLTGGSSLSHFQDAASFIIDCGSELVMIDSGAGKGSKAIEKNIRDIPCDPSRISSLILTHCHVDHIGSAKYFHDAFGCRIVAHDLDAAAIETGNPLVTAASWYGTRLPETPVDVRLHGDHGALHAGSDELHWIHTPGHTPGSISLYLDRQGKRVLFGQDIHGPFNKEWGSDMNEWHRSMQRLLVLDADILCEGHFGIYQPAEAVRQYIESYLRQYQR